MAKENQETLEPVKDLSLKKIMGATAHWVILMGEFVEANHDEFLDFVKLKNKQYDEAISVRKGQQTSK